MQVKVKNKVKKAVELFVSSSFFMAEKLMFEGASGTITHVSATNPVPVTIISGGGGGSSTPSDNFANPTTANLGMSFNMIWDGSTWDRVPGDSTYGIKTQPTLIPQAFDNTNLLAKVINIPLAVGTYAWDSDSSSTLEASSVTKASAGNIRLFSGYIDSATPSGIYYLQFFNSTSVPADTTAIAANFIAPCAIYHTTGTITTINLDFTDNCKYFSTGLAWNLSSTAFTKTLTSAYVSATVFYK